jgi:hypothetical protein
VPGQKSMHVGQRGELPRARTWPQFRLVGPGPAHTPLRLLAVHGELVPVLLLQGRPQAQAGQARQGRPVHPRHIQPVHRHRQRVDRLLLRKVNATVIKLLQFRKNKFLVPLDSQNLQNIMNV